MQPETGRSDFDIAKLHWRSVLQPFHVARRNTELHVGAQCDDDATAFAIVACRESLWKSRMHRTRPLIREFNLCFQP